MTGRIMALRKSCPGDLPSNLHDRYATFYFLVNKQALIKLLTCVTTSYGPTPRSYILFQIAPERPAYMSRTPSRVRFEYGFVEPAEDGWWTFQHRSAGEPTTDS